MDAPEIDNMSARTSHRNLEIGGRRLLLFRLLATVFASTIALGAYATAVSAGNVK